MFNDFLSGYGGSMRDRSPYTDADYFAYVDGKPRYAGVRDFLGSRGVHLPEGSPEDRRARRRCPAWAIGRTTRSTRSGARRRRGLPGHLHLLDHLHELGMPLGVVSSSANATVVLEAAGIADRFDTVGGRPGRDRDGAARQAGPDTFLHAAEQPGAPPSGWR